MIPIAARLATIVVALTIVSAPARSQPVDTKASSNANNVAAGVELWSSTDSDKTDVIKLLGRALWDFEGPDKFQGIDIERAWFRPQAQHTRRQTRVYLDLAGSLAGDWKWSTRIGTNGHTILGTANVRAADWSKELFVEREIVETPRGLDQGIYYTFVGGSMDLPATKQDIFSVMAGFQKFTGRNERLHLRGTYVHVVKAKSGLSVQLRTRYFHSTVPGEFDYYSPRDFLQVLPVVQMRRFDGAGWMYLVALGYGAQKATGTHWQASRLAEFRIESPARSSKLRAFVQLEYSNNSLTGSASNYHYILGRVGFTRRL